MSSRQGIVRRAKTQRIDSDGRYPSVGVGPLDRQVASKLDQSSGSMQAPRRFRRSEPLVVSASRMLKTAWRIMARFDSTARPTLSKVALVHLAARLERGSFRLLDAQFVTSHLASPGASAYRAGSCWGPCRACAAGRADQASAENERAGGSSSDPQKAMSASGSPAVSALMVARQSSHER